MEPPIIRAMRRCGNVNAFVKDYLIPALGYIPPKIEVPKKQVPPYYKKREKGEYARIVFVNESNPKNECHFRLQRNMYDDETIRRMQGTSPCAAIFGGMGFSLPKKTWGIAARSLGILQRTFQSGGGGTSRILLIPKTAVEHWSVKEGVGKHGEKVAAVPINARLYETLERARKMERFIDEFKNLVLFMNGEITDKHYINLRERWGSFTAKREFLVQDYFLHEQGEHLPTLERIIKNRNAPAIAAHLRERFQVEGPAVERRANELEAILSRMPEKTSLNLQHLFRI
ncbi:hypothetical protein HY991_01490 [Candidatus Micrarchaeota archaeon]|nr:hypothetical protein [Candidatus Micrarchaeota archaeon]